MEILMNKQELQYLLKKLYFLKEEVDVNENKYLDKLIKRFERRLKPIKIASRKAKGRNLQKQISYDIAKKFNIDYRQDDDNCDIHSREMGQGGVDIVIRGNLLKKFPFSIECKNQEQINLYRFIEQAKKNMKENTYWLLILKNKKIRQPIVILDWKVFLNLI